MTTADTNQTMILRRRLAADLRAKGALDDTWAHAFDAVPRHAFVPEFWINNDGQFEHVDHNSPQWLQRVYTDDVLITQLTNGIPTSSSTAPALMLQMLAALDVTPDSQVLEIGTGTGYNAALLSQQIGDDRVTSLDVDPTLVDTATQRLRDVGYKPQLISADGRTTAFAAEAFNRIIATCRFQRIPAQWLHQLRPGGVIVCPIGAGTVRLIVAEDHTASGRFLPDPAHFMPTRNANTTATPAYPGRPTDAGTRPTSLVPRRIADDTYVQFLVSLMDPDIILSHQWDNHDTIIAIEAWATDRSWLRIANGVASTAGRRSLLPVLRRAVSIADHGEPDRTRLGVTVTPSGQTIWLDSPETIHANSEQGPIRENPTG